MTAEYVVGLLGVLGSLVGLVALVWAVRHRQLETQDLEMYAALGEDEPDFGPQAVPVPRSKAWLLAAALTGIFGLIGWMLWQTVAAVTRSPVVPATPPQSVTRK